MRNRPLPRWIRRSPRESYSGRCGGPGRRRREPFNVARAWRGAPAPFGASRIRPMCDVRLTPNRKRWRSHDGTANSLDDFPAPQRAESSTTLKSPSPRCSGRWRECRGHRADHDPDRMATRHSAEEGRRDAMRNGPPVGGSAAEGRFARRATIRRFGHGILVGSRNHRVARRY